MKDGSHNQTILRVGRVCHGHSVNPPIDRALYVAGNSVNGDSNSRGGSYIYLGSLTGATVHVTGDSPNNIEQVG